MCSFAHKQGGFAPCSGLREIPLRIELAGFKAKICFYVFNRALATCESLGCAGGSVVPLG